MSSCCSFFCVAGWPQPSSAAVHMLGLVVCAREEYWPEIVHWLDWMWHGAVHCADATPFSLSPLEQTDIQHSALEHHSVSCTRSFHPAGSTHTHLFAFHRRKVYSCRCRLLIAFYFGFNSLDLPIGLHLNFLFCVCMF